MELVQVNPGMALWMLFSFLIVFLVLRKFAWKPILKALKEREESIEDSLKSAEKAKEEMAKLKADNEKIMAEAKSERDKLLKEAREIKDKIIAEAKTQASVEAEKLISAAKASIQSEKNAAISEMKDTIASLSIEIAEKILKETLKDPESQKKLIERSLEDIKLN